MISKDSLKTILKNTYLEIASGYDVSDLHHDSDKVSCVASRFRNSVLEKIKALKEDVRVYVLLAVQDMNNFTDHYGEAAGEQEQIKGIFTKLSEAEEIKKDLEKENLTAVNELECDPVCYKIVPWSIT